MRIAIEHHTTRAKARTLVEQRLRDAETQYGPMASDLHWEWRGDTLHVAVKTRGMSLKGTLEINDTDVVFEGQLPLLARPFESRIRQTVEREAESMFRTA